MEVALKRIVSGGQRGPELAALAAARHLGLRTYGWAPSGWINENGKQESLLRSFNLIEGKNLSSWDRVRKNIELSEATIVFGRVTRPSISRIYNTCELLGKLWLINPSKEGLQLLLNQSEVSSLHVTGDRESIAPGLQEIVRSFLVETIGELYNDREDT